MARPEGTLYYDPRVPYEENVLAGPFGELANGERFVTEGKPSRLFLGLPVHLDLGVSAGPAVNGRAVCALLDHGWDVATYKTTRSGQWSVNGFPNLQPVRLGQMYNHEIASTGIVTGGVFQLPGSATNSYGVPSAAPEVWVPDAAAAVAYAREGQVVVVSFQGTVQGNGDVEAFIRDHQVVASYVRGTGALIAEVNGSCPNEGSHHLLCLDPEMSARAVEASRRGLGDKAKLLMKLCFFPSDDILRELVQKTSPFVNGYTVINTMPARTLDEQGNPAFGKGRETSGISGQAIFPWALDMVGRMNRIRAELGLNFAIVAVGGVSGRKQYDMFKEAGADGGVEVATGSLINPHMAVDIKTQLGMKVVKV